MKHIHFIGIAGKAMSGLAVMLKDIGYSVTGSDAGSFDPVASYLKKNGLDFYTQYSASNIPTDADMIVIGKHAKLTLDNPEVATAFESGKKIYSLPQLTAELATTRTQIVIAGSFGKSTCSGMASWILSQADENPGYFIGGEIIGMEKSAAFGADPYFVIEGDEYPSSNFDDRAKFLHFNPKFLLLTSGEHDHVNVFPTIESYLKPYQELIRNMPADGTIVACDHGAHLRKILRNAPCKVLWYGYTDYCDYKIGKTTYGNTSTVELTTSAGVVEIQTQLLGKHNIENIAGVFGLLDTIGIAREKITSGVKTFKGVKGRLDKLSNDGAPVEIFLGFGSSHAKVRGCIDAIKLHYPNKKLHIIFEPHTFSWRDLATQYWYNDAFTGAENVCVVMPPTEHGKEATNALSADTIKDLIQNSGQHATIAYTESEVKKWFADTVKNDNIVLLLTSGDLLGIPKNITAW